MNKFRSLIGYGIGDYGLNIYWNTISFYLVFWYTTFVGLEPRVAGLLYLIGMVWDAVSDPIMASIAERVDTKYGSYRPFLFYGSGFLAISFFLLFWIPPFEGMTLILVLMVLHLLFRTAYTIVAIPYSAMSSRLTYDSVERSEFSGVRMFFAFAGLLTVSMFLPPLLESYSAYFHSEKQAFKWVAATGGCIATIALLLCFANTKEQPLPKLTRQSEKVWHGILTTVRKNRALQLLLFIILFKTAATASLNISMVFFIEANQQSFSPKEVVLTAYAIATMVFVPFWTILIRRVGRKRVWFIASFLTALAGLHMLIFQPWLIMGVPMQVVIFGACGGAFSILIWAFIPDCVEYGQDVSGYRSEAGVFGSALIVQKMSGGIMGFLVGIMLHAIGYDPNKLNESTEVGEKLVTFIAVFPALYLAITLIPLIFLPLGREIHADIVDRLSGINVNAKSDKGE